MDYKIWDPLHECLDSQDLEGLQLECLRTTLERVDKGPCNKEKFRLSLGIAYEAMRI